MKARRHAMILHIIREREIETQEELAEALREQGINVTQATVSRDIKELRLVKVPKGDGHYRYGIPHEPVPGDSLRRAQRTFQDYVLEIDFSQNMIVLKTLPGTANAVAAAIDALHWPQILATVAGDDTILVIVKTEGEVVPTGPLGEVLERFRRLRHE